MFVIAEQTRNVQLGEIRKGREAANTAVQCEGAQRTGSARKKGYVLVVVVVCSGKQAHILQLRRRDLADCLHEKSDLARGGTPYGESAPPRDGVAADDLRVDRFDDIEADGYIQ